MPRVTAAASAKRGGSSLNSAATLSKATGALCCRWTADVGAYPTVVAWSRDGAYVAIACAEGYVLIVDGTTGGVAHVLAAHAMGTLAADWSAPTDTHPHGLLATAGQDGFARLWNPVSGALIADLDAGANGDLTGVNRSRTVVAWCEHLTWSRDGVFLATAAGRQVRLWNREGVLVRTHPAFAGTVNALAWRPNRVDGRDADNLTAAGYGGAVMFAPHVDAAASGRAVAYESAIEHRFDWKGLFLSLAWSPTARILVSGMQENAIHVWQRTKVLSDETPYVDLEMSGYPMKVRALAWDAEGSVLATGGAPTVTVWSMGGKGPSGTKPASLRGHALPVSHLSFYRSGKVLASGGEDGQLIIWDLVRSSRKPIGSTLHPGEVSSLAWAPRSRCIVASHATGVVEVWDVAP